MCPGASPNPCAGRCSRQPAALCLGRGAVKGSCLSRPPSSWDQANAKAGAWIHAFLAETSISKKLLILVQKCEDPDEGSQAVAQLIACEPTERAHAFAFAVYPAALSGKLPIGAEGVHDLARLATATYTVNGEISWQESMRNNGSTHPEIVAFTKVLALSRAPGASGPSSSSTGAW